MTTKKTLVGNLFAKLRGGEIAKTVTFPGDGTYIVQHDGKFTAAADYYGYDEWNPVNLVRDEFSTSTLDIVALYRPCSPTDLLNFSFDETACDLVWNEKITTTRNEDVSNEDGNSNTNPSEIRVTTSVWIEVNGKPVDLQNLSEEEGKVLKALGII